MDSEGGERAGVFAADDAAPDDDHLLRDRLDGQQRVAIDDDLAVDVDPVRLLRMRASGDENEFARDAPDVLTEAAHLDGVSVENAGRALDLVDPVPLEI